MKTVFLAAFCFAAWSCSVFAGEAEEKKIGVLPGDMIVHIRTGQIENTLQNIEEFLVEAVRGTPLMMQMQPGMLKTVLPLQLGLPLELLTLPKASKSRSAIRISPTTTPRPGLWFPSPTSTT